MTFIIRSIRIFSDTRSLSNNQDLDLTPVPKEERGPELTFQETGQQKTFMFAQSNTFIQIDGDIIQTFQLR